MQSNGVHVKQDLQLGAEGPLQVWEWPDKSDRYVIGADVAEGMEWGDYSDATVLSVLSGEMVAKWHGRIDADLFGEQLWMLGTFYGNALVGVENNNHGLTVITALRHLNYPNLYRQTVLDQISKKQGVRWGWRTDKASKPLMIDELNKALREGSVKVRDEATLKELRSYVRDEKGRMHGSPHDDRVMSLAIANQMRQVSFMPAYSNPINDTWTFDWWARQAKKAEERGDGMYMVGRHNGR